MILLAIRRSITASTITLVGPTQWRRKHELVVLYEVQGAS